MNEFIKMTDGYKLDHRRQYPEDTQFVCSNFTARSSRIVGQDYVVKFGLQYFLQRYFGEIAQETFFGAHRGDVLRNYESLLQNYLGPDAADAIGIEHIANLHDLGYIPLQFRALPEGTRVPLRVPMFTWVNTHPDFAWTTNYFETLLSSVMWLACTSATTADRYRGALNNFAEVTKGNLGFVPFQAHDFSFRGMASPEAAALSGAAHLLSFTGSDVIPAIDLLIDYYGADGCIAGTVPATEHSVMCAGGKATEMETYNRLLGLYPSGIVSIVSDTWDLWNVIENILPALKPQIMARNGKLVIRPDSGDPADILCGNPDALEGSAPYKGVIQLLWEQFGGAYVGGYKQLDEHVGAIYGDSITYDRANEICARLAAKGFSSTNVVLGIGSYTYQHVTRDTYSMAIKSTWATVNGEERFLMKDPITDDGVKKSATGLISVVKENGQLVMKDGLSAKSPVPYGDLLEPVWIDGRFLKTQSLTDIRNRLWPSA